jgi:hypothetical protein
MKPQTQKEIVLKELEMVKEIIKAKKKEGLRHHQEIIIKVDVEIEFKNKEIKSFKNEQLNMYEELKGNERGFALVRRRIKYSVGSYGKCLGNSSKGSETSSGKGEEIMEGVENCTR